MAEAVEEFDECDPLEGVSGADPGLIVAAQRREITNILRSYVGYYDLFSELIQNSLDAVERRVLQNEEGYIPKVWVNIDLRNHSVCVTDNGCAMTSDQLRQFLRPNFSFKTGKVTRGAIVESGV